MANIFHVRAKRRRMIWIGYALLCVAIYGRLAIKEALFTSGFGEQTFIFAGIFLLPAVYMFYRARLFSRFDEQKIFFRHSTLYLPQCIGKKTYSKIKYKDIRAFDVRGKGRTAFYCIQTDNRSFHLPYDAFRKKNSWSAFQEKLLNKIKELPNGSCVLNKFEKQQRVSKHVFSLQPTTLIICTLLTCVFVYQAMSEQLSVHHLISIGAANTNLFFSGEFFRLLSGSVLHASTIHFLCNITILFAFCYVLEGLCGAAFVLLVLVTGQCIGVFLSLLEGQDIIVGTSAGVYALIGAYFFITQRRMLYLPAGLVLPKTAWLIFLSFNAALFFLFPNVSFTAHFGGFIMGVLVADFYIRKEYIDKEDTLLTIKARRALIPLSIICTLLSFQFILYVSDSWRAKQANVSVLSQILNRGTAKISELNLFAWNIAIDHNVDTSLLELADNAIQKAIELAHQQKEQLDHLIDTRASIYFRQKEIAKALDDEMLLFLKASDKKRQAFYASQMQRFVDERLQDEPLLVLTKEKKLETSLPKEMDDKCLFFVFPESSYSQIQFQQTTECKSKVSKILANTTNKVLIFEMSATLQQSNVLVYPYDARVLFYPYN